MNQRVAFSVERSGAGSICRAICFLPAAFCLLVEVVRACPMCSEALVAPGEAAAHSRLAQGYAFTIIGMMGLPLMLVGCITALVVCSVRRSRR